jgi:hypothetical protein
MLSHGFFGKKDSKNGPIQASMLITDGEICPKIADGPMDIHASGKVIIVKGIRLILGSENF